MTLRINQVAFGLGRGVLGATGNRMGVWTQGCSLPKCPGCASMHARPQNGGREINIGQLLGLVSAQAIPPSGLTISGGEPTDQAPEVEAFIKAFRDLFPKAEVVLYTGLCWQEFSGRFPVLAGLADVIVAGPYVRTLPATPLAGSANQEVMLLTPLARRLYEGWRNWPMHRMQVGNGKAGDLVTVGIPHTLRMTRAAAMIGATGVTWDMNEEAERP